MADMKMQIDLRKVPKHPDVFEFTVSTPVLRTQFRLPRNLVNKLRVLIEKALTKKE